MRIKVTELELLEPGYRKVYTQSADAQEPVAAPGESRLRRLKKGQRVKPQRIRAHRLALSEAGLIGLMQSGAIGRPATYAVVIDSLLQRKYVSRENGALLVTDRGRAALAFLISEYPDLFSLDFTRQMERWLDDVLRTGAQGYKKAVGRLWDTIQS